MKDNAFATIEIGDFSSKLIIASAYNGKLNICGSFICETQGVINGEIVSKSEASRTISTLLEQAEQFGYTVDETVLILPSTGLNVYRKKASNQVNGANRVVTERDIELLKRACSKHQITEGEIVVGIYPIQYLLDNENLKKEEPIGYRGTVVTLDAFILTLPSSIARGFIDLLQEMGIQILDAIVTPLANAQLLLRQDEYKSGALILDMGGNHLSVSLFFDNLLCGYKQAKTGGNYITNQLSTAFSLDKKNAEFVKVTYGGALLNKASNVGVYKSPNGNTVLKEIEIVSCIENSLNALGVEINKIIDFITQDKVAPLIITGGGSNMENIAEKISQMTKFKVIYRAKSTVGARDSAFNACLGGLIYFLINKGQLNPNYQIL